MKLLTQNSLLRATSKATRQVVLNFGIPALELPSGKRTCPFAGECAKYCYALGGAYVWSNVAPVYRARYEATLRPDFEVVMLKELKQRQPTFVRIHDAGDWYSRDYRDKWLNIIRESPSIRFYTYTKSVPLFKEIDVQPRNLCVIFSLGGTMDHLIDLDRDRHARIFDTHEELEQAGYTSANRNDLMATNWYNPNPRVGLVWNGGKKPRKNAE